MTGIIAAMKIEAERIGENMEDCRTERVGSFDFLLGKIAGEDVAVTVCGVGKVFAAMAAQTMILTYSPGRIINVGVGGTLSDSLGIGDIAVATGAVQHDMDTSALGDPPGMISGINLVVLPCSDVLAERIYDSALREGIHCEKGIVASGDRFVCAPEDKKRISGAFGAVVCEMEGAAIAQVCFVNNVECTIIRSVSDTADGKGAEDFGLFARESADISARVLVSLLEKGNR